MFTGIVERTGRIVSLTTPLAPQATSSPEGVAANSMMGSITQLLVDADRGFDTKPGDSIAINGCCLTVTSNKVQMLAFDVSRETLARTSLGALVEGAEVNLERALKLGDRLGGHLVSGHVDDVATVERILKKPDGWELILALNAALGRFVIHKGSICIDGVSLTVSALADRDDRTMVGISLIPTTVSLTSFKNLREGLRVNVEVDQVGKYIERLTQSHRRD